METPQFNIYKLISLGIPLSTNEKKFLQEKIKEIKHQDLQDLFDQNQILVDREAFLRKNATWSCKKLLTPKQLKMVHQYRDELEKDVKRFGELLKSDLDQALKGRIKQTRTSFKELIRDTQFPDKNEWMRETPEYKEALAAHQQALANEKLNLLVKQAGGRIMEEDKNGAMLDSNGNKYFMIVLKNTPRINAILVYHQANTQLRIAGNKLCKDEGSVPTVHQGSRTDRIAIPISGVDFLVEKDGQVQLSTAMVYNWELSEVVEQLLDPSFVPQ